MKRVLITVLASVIAFIAFAQEAHLKFKGIPINGNYKAFAQQLIQKGFKQLEASQDAIVLSGNFMTIPDVMVLVYPDPASKVVSSVSAFVEAGNKWATIENKYEDIVDTYKEKYGNPSQHIEEFTTEVHNDDFFRKNALENGQCNYKSIWEIEGGRIVITLVYFQFKYYVLCGYVDEQNEKALRQTIIDDI